MVKLSVKDILASTGARLISGSETAEVPSLSTDTRNIIPGSFFIAIKGRSFDAHDFVVEALEAGAAGAVVDKPVDLPDSLQGKHVIMADDTTSAMGKIAALIRSRVDIPVICITGTNGKTTTKEILAHVLSSKFKVLKSKKSFNNIIGLSLTLFDMEADHQAAVLEVGTNHPGEIAELASIASPRVAVITNIGDGHLEFLGDRRGVLKEKASLLDSLPVSGLAILNKDDELLSGLKGRGFEIRSFGRAEGSDLRIADIRKTDCGYVFSANGERYSLPLEGEHNVYNAAAAISVARYLWMTPQEIRESLVSVCLPDMRLQKVAAGGNTFINDSYNANPCSFECALKVLGECGDPKRKGVVAGDMMELGARAGDFHRQIGRSIAEKGMDFLVAVGSNAQNTIDGAVEHGMDSSRALRASDHKEAADMVRRLAPDGAVILLKGSRSSKMEEVLKCFTTSCTR